MSVQRCSMALPREFTACEQLKRCEKWDGSGFCTPRQALVLLPMRQCETEASKVAYHASLSQALIDDNTGHVNVVVCETDYKALKRGIELCRRRCSRSPVVFTSRANHAALRESSLAGFP